MGHPLVVAISGGEGAYAALVRSGQGGGQARFERLQERFTSGWLVRVGEREFVTNVGAADPEDDVFGDVGGVVADALEIAGDDQGVEGLGGELGFFLDEGGERVEGSVVHVVDLIVEFEDGAGEVGIAFDEGLEGFADHGGGERGAPRRVFLFTE